MGAPIIIDDGGSIRLGLKDPNSDGEMETLFKVNNNHQSNHDINHSNNQSYNEVRIFWLDNTGDLKQTTPDTYPCKTVKIISHVGMEIKAQIIKNQNQVKLTVSHNSVDPVFMSKEHRKKRSYAILNGGRIQRIEVEHPPDADRSVDIPEDALYSCVVII